MKTSVLLITAGAFSLGAVAKGTHASSGHVNPRHHALTGYTTTKRTTIAPSPATNPNSTKADNYSEKGNVNPYTGKEGTK